MELCSARGVLVEGEGRPIDGIARGTRGYHDE